MLKFIVIFVANFFILPVHSELCPCEDQTLCQPVEYSGNEVFAFMTKAEQNVWQNFDWTKLTTLVMFDFYDPELMCFAHKNKVRVVGMGVFPKNDLLDDQKVDQWIENRIQYTKDRFLDGINIDIEYEIDSDSPLVNGLSEFMVKLSDRFHEALPKSQITFDVPWSPYNVKGTGVDGRNYNFTALAKASDFLFIMAYAEQSQIFGTDCKARANSGLYDTAGGVSAYLDLGIDPNKLVLGLPWYGYYYKCIRTGPNDICYIKEVPFRGVNCSDAAGHPISYVDIVPLGDKYGTHADHHTQTSYLFYNDTDGFYRSIWYDDPGSLSLKIGFATYKNLRGVGVWKANMLDYSGSAKSKSMISDMWGTFPYYKT